MDRFEDHLFNVKNRNNKIAVKPFIGFIEFVEFKTENDKMYYGQHNRPDKPKELKNNNLAL